MYPLEWPIVHGIVPPCDACRLGRTWSCVALRRNLNGEDGQRCGRREDNSCFYLGGERGQMVIVRTMQPVSIGGRLGYTHDGYSLVMGWNTGTGSDPLGLFLDVVASGLAPSYHRFYFGALIETKVVREIRQACAA